MQPWTRAMARRRVSISSVQALRMLEEHREGVLACARCAGMRPEAAAPVVDVAKAVRAMLVAQAPGSTELVTRRPFTGPAGKRLEGWFARAGVTRQEIYLSAVARCFPGKARGGGDLVPSRAMIRNCRPHLRRELELLKPEVVVPVGGLALKELLGIGRLSDAIGEVFERDGVAYVPLPHPSGASTWLNRRENKERLAVALGLLGERMAVLKQKERRSVDF